MDNGPQRSTIRVGSKSDRRGSGAFQKPTTETLDSRPETAQPRRKDRGRHSPPAWFESAHVSKRGRKKKQRDTIMKNQTHAPYLCDCLRLHTCHFGQHLKHPQILHIQKNPTWMKTRMVNFAESSSPGCGEERSKFGAAQSFAKWTHSPSSVPATMALCVSVVKTTAGCLGWGT